MTTVTTIGIDTGKSVFHLIGVNHVGRPILKKSLRRSAFLNFLANLPPCLIGMEACGGSNYWRAKYKNLAHTVKLMDGRFVKPFVKGNKNDFNDAEGIVEAVQRPTMRFVPIKSSDQQDIQSVHRVRAALMRQRTAISNQIRGILGEYGIVIPIGISTLRRKIPLILEDAENGLSDLLRDLIHEQCHQLISLDNSIKSQDKRIESILSMDTASQRLQTVSGFGPVIATALASALGDGSAFKNGRQVAAWFGLVPRQHSTGGKTVLLGISKRGDRYLRTLLIHGARSVVRGCEKKADSLSVWVTRIKNQKGVNVATVALANKLARIAWAMLFHGSDYRISRA